jgi:capsular polysaccharide transport system permease protein
MAALTYLSAAVAALNGVMSILWTTWERIWSISRFPMLVLSGIFYVPVNMPPALQSILFWNPVVHCVEWMRTGIYMTYEPMLSVPYLLGFSTLVLFAALLLERGYRYRMYG